MMGFARVALAFAIASRVSAIHVADGSPCESLCGNVLDATTSEDVVCDQNDYSSIDAGVVYQQCTSCELESGYHSSSNETDVQWLLYNFRWNVGYCLYGEPNNDHVADNPCLTGKACGLFRDAVLYKNMSSDVGEFDYCDVWPVDDTLDFDGCTECLQVGDQTYLANYITILQAGCEQRPEPGVTVAFEGTVFSTDHVNVTAPTPTATVNPDWFDNGPINLGAKVGIAVGGLVFVLCTLGCCIVWNGKRRRRAYLRTIQSRAGQRPAGQRPKGWPTPGHLTINSEMNETPVSQRPLRGWDDSPLTATSQPLSARSDGTFPRYFSPYSSQYNSPVSATDAMLPNWPVMGHAQMPSQDSGHHTIGMAIGGAEPSEGSSSKGKSTDESYEMHQVDSNNTGNGSFHHDDSSQYGHYHQEQYDDRQQYQQGYNATTEEDMRRGHAM